MNRRVPTDQTSSNAHPLADATPRMKFLVWNSSRASLLLMVMHVTALLCLQSIGW